MSGSRKDLFGTDGLYPVDRLRPDETTVALHGVDGFASASSTSGGDRLPVGGELGAGKATCPLLDRASHDPLNVEAGGVVGLADHDRSRVLDAQRIDAIDRVGASEAASGAVGGEITRKRTGVQHGTEQSNGEDPHKWLGDVHEIEPSEPHREAAMDEGPDLAAQRMLDGEIDRFVTPRWMKLAVGLVLVMVSAAIAFAVFEPIQVLPRLRLAPGYSLTDQSGDRLTSEDVRGSVTLYTFVSLECGDRCRDIDETMRFVQERVAAEVDLGDTEFHLVTIVLDDGPTIAELAAVAEQSGADGESWTVVGGDDSELRNVVGNGFGRFYSNDGDAVPVRFDPGFVLVDGAGVIRGDYRYQTLADDGDKLLRHIDVLSSELKYADGSAALAYEAAHLFLCYP